MIESNKLAVLLENALFSNKNTFSVTEKNVILSKDICADKVRYYCNWLTELKVNSLLIYSSPSVEMMCLCYALILTNKTYIPVHTSTSAELLATYLKTYSIDLLVVQSELVPQIDNEFNKLTEEGASSFFYCHLPASQQNSCLLPGAIFFTSGTSALPKAVYYQYETIYNYLCWCIEEFKLTEHDHFLFTTELSFIAALRPLFVPLFSGANVTFIPSEPNKVQAILTCLNQSTITTLNITPSLFKVLIQQVEHYKLDKLINIQLVLLSGETLDYTAINYWLEHISNTTIFYNLYGATEFLVPFYKKITKTLDEKERLQMGALRKGCDYKLITSDLGCELYITGDIATSYVDNQRTQDYYIFIDNKKFIKSSDFVILEKEGLYYRSRSQRIVKNYGQIINLDQIEYVLKKSYPLYNFVTTIDEHNTSDLHLIIESSQKSELLLSKIKSSLKQHLPRYMHPKEYHFIDKLPTTKSGKIDYLSLKQLISIQKSHEKSVEHYFKRFFPQQTVDINAEIMRLNLESIDFIELSMVLYKSTGKWLDLSKINQTTRISDLQLCLVQVNIPKPTLRNRVKINSAIVSFFITGNGKNLYLTSEYQLNPGINIDKLEHAIVQTIKQHFLLSCKIEQDQSNYFFVETNPQSEFRVPTEFSIFSFARKPQTLKIFTHSERLIYFYIQKKKNKHYLTMAYHHVLLDGWSALLVREHIFRCYEGVQENYLNRKEEIACLNKIDELRLLPKRESLQELENEHRNINPLEYNQDCYFLYNKELESKNSSFTISSERFDQFVKKNKLEDFSASIIFILILQQAFAEQVAIKKFLITLTLSNRNLPIPHVQKLIANLATGLPFFFDQSDKTLIKCAEELKRLFTIYFKNMTYAGVQKIWEKELINHQSFKRDCTISYTYINNIIDGECIQNKYINWEQSTNELSVTKSTYTFFRVYNQGPQFVIILNTILNKGVHEKLLHFIQRLLT